MVSGKIIGDVQTAHTNVHAMHDARAPFGCYVQPIRDSIQSLNKAYFNLGSSSLCWSMENACNLHPWLVQT